MEPNLSNTRQLFRSYYNIEDKNEHRGEIGYSATKEDVLNIDSECFDPDKYLKGLLETSRILKLYDIIRDVKEEVGKLTNSSKNIIYDNYPSFITATKLMGRVENLCDQMDKGKVELFKSLSYMFEKVDLINNEDNLNISISDSRKNHQIKMRLKNLYSKKEKLDKLKPIVNAPRKIRESIQNKDYKTGMDLYQNLLDSIEEIMKYKNVILWDNEHLQDIVTVDSSIKVDNNNSIDNVFKNINDPNFFDYVKNDISSFVSNTREMIFNDFLHKGLSLETSVSTINTLLILNHDTLELSESFLKKLEEIWIFLYYSYLDKIDNLRKICKDGDNKDLFIKEEVFNSLIEVMKDIHQNLIFEHYFMYFFSYLKLFFKHLDFKLLRGLIDAKSLFVDKLKNIGLNKNHNEQYNFDNGFQYWRTLDVIQILSPVKRVFIFIFQTLEDNTVNICNLQKLIDNLSYFIETFNEKITSLIRKLFSIFEDTFIKSTSTHGIKFYYRFINSFYEVFDITCDFNSNEKYIEDLFRSENSNENGKSPYMGLTEDSINVIDNNDPFLSDDSDSLNLSIYLPVYHDIFSEFHLFVDRFRYTTMFRDMITLSIIDHLKKFYNSISESKLLKDGINSNIDQCIEDIRSDVLEKSIFVLEWKLQEPFIEDRIKQPMAYTVLELLNHYLVLILDAYKELEEYFYLMMLSTRSINLSLLLIKFWDGSFTFIYILRTVLVYYMYKSGIESEYWKELDGIILKELNNFIQNHVGCREIDCKMLEPMDNKITEYLERVVSKKNDVVLEVEIENYDFKKIHETIKKMSNVVRDIDTSNFIKVMFLNSSYLIEFNNNYYDKIISGSGDKAGADSWSSILQLLKKVKMINYYGPDHVFSNLSLRKCEETNEISFVFHEFIYPSWDDIFYFQQKMISISVRNSDYMVLLVLLRVLYSMYVRFWTLVIKGQDGVVAGDLDEQSVNRLYDSLVFNIKFVRENIGFLFTKANINGSDIFNYGLERIFYLLDQLTLLTRDLDIYKS